MSGEAAGEREFFVIVEEEEEEEGVAGGESSVEAGGEGRGEGTAAEVAGVTTVCIV